MNSPPSLYTAYCDGSCYPNPNGFGGWAFLLISPSNELLERRGGEPSATNNTMEFSAAISAIYAFEKEAQAGATLTIRSDSEYLVKSATTWIADWKQRSWLTSSYEPVKNLELVQEIERLNAAFPIAWLHVRGHSGNAGIERADVLAGEARKLMAKGLDASWERRCRWNAVTL